MNGFTLRLESLDGRDMPSASWAAGLTGANESAAHVVEMDQVSVQRSGGLSGGIEGAVGGAEVAGGARGGIVDVAGGARGGIVDVAGGLTGGVVLGGALRGVTADRFAPIDVDGSAEISRLHTGEEIPQFQPPEVTVRVIGEEIPTFQSPDLTGGSKGEEIPSLM